MRTVSNDISDIRGGPAIRFSLGKKMAVIFLILAIVPMSGVAYYNLTQSRKEVARLARSELIGLSYSTANIIEQLFIENQRNSAMLAGDQLTLKFLSASDNNRRIMYPEIYRMLENFVGNHPDYDSPGLLDANGIVVAALEKKLVGKDRSFRDYFQASIKGKPYISDVLVGHSTGRPGVFLTNPIVLADGQIAGIVLIWLKADSIWKIIDDVKVGKEGIAYLVDQDGVIIAHPNRDLLYHSLGKLSPEAVSTISTTIRFGADRSGKKPVIPESLGMDRLIADITSEKGQGTCDYTSPINNRNYVAGYSTLKKQPWTVIVDIPEEQFMAPLNRMKTVAKISIGLVAVITIIISILLAESITRPIRRLSEISEDVKYDRFFHPSNVEDVISGHDEIAHLGRVFSGMVLSLRESEEKYRDIIDNSSYLHYRTDMEGRIIFVSQSVVKLSGYTVEETIGMKISEMYSVKSENRNVFFAVLQHNGSVENFEEQLKRKNGSIWWVSTNAHFYKDKKGNILGVEGVTRDVTDRKNAEERLRRLRNYLNNIINSMPSVLAGVDKEGKVTQWNREAERITGISRDEAMGQPIEDVLSEFQGKRELIEKVFRSKEVYSGKQAPFQRNGKSIFENITIYPLITNGVDGAVIRIDDVTKEHILEEQLSQSRKMDAIGRLAGGVAHDFNNILAGIMGAAQILKSPKRGLDERGKKYADLIVRAAERAAELTSKLLAFGRKGKISSTAVDVHAIIDDTVAILKSTIDKRVLLIIEKGADNHTVIGDSSELQNVLINLGINASHAMPKGGELRVKTGNILLTRHYCNASPFKIEPGGFIQIEVRDTGIGISPENRKRIFEPFFTTRENGKGTGLGLAAVYGTVQDHHGAIKVYSEPGVGTEFHILLPCSEKGPEKIITGGDILKGAGTILLVDDEEIIRITGKTIMEEMGYDVIQAENGREGVEIFRENYAGIDLVILDMIMPEMNGQEAFHRMMEIDGGCRIVISSGFTKDESIEELKESGLSGFIRKPFGSVELSRLLSDILNRSK